MYAPPDIPLQGNLASQLAAEIAGLTYATTEAPGLRRRRAGKGFTYLTPEGRRVADRQVLRRIRSLVIPPAWDEVWISPDPNGHIQAFGEDERGRRQYRYHPRFREVREGAKFEHMIAFAEALPRLRRQVERDMAAPGLGRRKVLATVVRLLEATMIRVGNAAYAKENGSYGLTTLRVRHVKLEGAELRFQFKGKSGKEWKLSFRDRRVAAVVRRCQELPGQHLFQYLDDDGARQSVTSADVNAYLKDVVGFDVSAKNFRTWTGTVLAAAALSEIGAAPSQAAAKRNVAAAIKTVAARLGNTPTVCRKCYVHPEIVDAYLEGRLLLPECQPEPDPEGAGADYPVCEQAVLAFLRERSAIKLAA